jgi:hypothetical protein
MNLDNNTPSSSDLPELASQINEALHLVPDKEWNYSRITLELCRLSQIDSPYVLWVERVKTDTRAGGVDLAQLKSEIAWGSRHSEQLGFLEIVSLRLNKTLLENTPDESWAQQRPVIRVVKKEELESQGLEAAFWYRIQEVGGEEFDDR